MDSDDDLPPVLVSTAVETKENEAENGLKVPLTIVTGECRRSRDSGVPCFSCFLWHLPDLSPA